MFGQTILTLASLSLFAFACGGAVSSEPGPTPEPTPGPIATARPAPSGPAGNIQQDPPSKMPTAPVASDVLADTACKNTKILPGDGNVSPSVHRPKTSTELTALLAGGWVACDPSLNTAASATPLFPGRGVSLHADGSASSLTFDGHTFGDGAGLAPWSADPNPPFADQLGLRFLVGDVPYWAFIALDGKSAVMGTFDSSFQFVFVNVAALSTK